MINLGNRKGSDEVEQNGTGSINTEEGDNISMPDKVGGSSIRVSGVEGSGISNGVEVDGTGIRVDDGCGIIFGSDGDGLV